MKYQAGAFGQIGEPETLLKYWTFLEKNDYPNSADIKNMFVKAVEERKQQEQMAMIMQQMAQQGGGLPNGLPQM